MIVRRDLTDDPTHEDLIYTYSELDRKLSQLRLQEIDKGQLLCISYKYVETPDGIQKQPLYTYTGLRCAFDIETSTKYTTNIADGKTGYYSAMYVCQFAINNRVILCRTWYELRMLWDRLISQLHLSDNTVLLTWVHNLDYETSYIKHRFEIDRWSYFCKSRTKPIKYLANKHIYLHDSYSISNSTLAKLADMYKCDHHKMTGDIDHDVIRNSSTTLDDKELGYICNDVLILTDFAQVMYDTFLQPEGYIPDTSTQILRKELESAAGDPVAAAEMLGQKTVDNICNKYPDGAAYKLRKRIHGTIFGYYYINHDTGETVYIPGWIDPKMFTPFTPSGSPVPIQGYKDDNGFKRYDLYRWLFRGGYTKSNCRYTSSDAHLPDGIEGLIGAFDFTSSYPFVQTIYDYPMSKFVPCRDPSPIILDPRYTPDSAAFSKRRYIMLVAFKGLHSIDDMALESESKCVIKGRKIIDNGRVRYADNMLVWLTDVDLALYRMYYRWDKIKVISSWAAKAGKLPDYFLRVLWRNGMIKQSFKNVDGKEVEYNIAKSKFNSAYGLCCRMPIYHDYRLGTEVTPTGYITTEIDTYRYLGKRISVDHQVDRDYELRGMECISDVSKSDYLSTVSSSILSPFWGIWTSAFARYNLLRLVKQVSDDTAPGAASDVLYCDTDSMYILNYIDHLHIIEAWNAWAAKRVQQRLPAEYDLLMSLGQMTNVADEESKGKADHYVRFKTLGAKRYIKSWADSDGQLHTKVTVAGLPKGVLEAHCAKYNLDIYRTFANLMDFVVDSELIPDPDERESASKIKMGRTYHDELVKINMAGEIMTEYSSCTLYKTTFKLKMSEIYIQLISEMAETIAGGRYGY